MRGARLQIAPIAFAILFFVAAVAVLLALVLAPSSKAAGLWIGVQGNHLVDKDGDPVRLLGVNRSGTEYQCIEGGEIFDGPSDPASIKAMKSWHINAVRVPLNESCWLGINGVDPGLGGAPYRDAIRAYVQRLEKAGLYVILEMQWAAPGRHQATGIIPMADAEHAPDFWRSVAEEYRDDRAVVFDLYNEPHDISWDCWESGCEVYDQWFGHYRAAGMTELVAAVRETGAQQPLMLGGIDWSRDLRGWLAYLPADPANALVAANHTYDFNSCHRVCRAALARIAKRYPVVTGELGQGDCQHWYVSPYMRWADKHGVSYLGWTWNAGNGWTCESGPSLISDYTGTPTPYGIGLRNHLRKLHANQRRCQARSSGAMVSPAVSSCSQ